jgi:hypothetical protein
MNQCLFCRETTCVTTWQIRSTFQPTPFVNPRETTGRSTPFVVRSIHTNGRCYMNLASLIVEKPLAVSFGRVWNHNPLVQQGSYCYQSKWNFPKRCTSTRSTSFCILTGTFYAWGCNLFPRTIWEHQTLLHSFITAKTCVVVQKCRVHT